MSEGPKLILVLPGVPLLPLRVQRLTEARVFVKHSWKMNRIALRGKQASLYFDGKRVASVAFPARGRGAPRWRAFGGQTMRRLERIRVAEV